ncbi:MAG: competence/damage-inducible protein A [Myxococcales bacterium]|nr:competence/damage-inducible protein A [Myxococcales bacterium]
MRDPDGGDSSGPARAPETLGAETAAILTIGTELCRGELLDGNAAWLAEELTSLGAEIVQLRSVDDDRERIADSLSDLARQVSLVLVTGGLGPTSDDLTREALADAMGVPLRLEEGILERIRSQWAARGLPMPEPNVKQAWNPEGAELLDNPIGSAPGLSVKLGQARLILLPGVPREMRHIFEQSVLRRVAPTLRRTSHQLHLRTFGLRESEIAARLETLGALPAGVQLGYRAHDPEIEVKILARAPSAADAARAAEALGERVREALGDVVYGDHADTFAGVVGRALRDRGLRLALAESCTGGMIGAMLTSVPGSSEFLILDAVVYANAAKERLLGVREETLRGHGAVSAETAAAMAEGALRVSGADLALAITGIAGPSGGSEGRPVGTVFFALSRRSEPTLTRRAHFPGDRDQIRLRAAYLALDQIRRAAIG